MTFSRWFTIPDPKGYLTVSVTLAKQSFLWHIIIIFAFIIMQCMFNIQQPHSYMNVLDNDDENGSDEKGQGGYE